VPFIFMTGYAARGDHGDPTIDPSLPVLAKPWSVDDLMLKVRETIGAVKR
jgi:hypothetical protein